MKLFGARPNDAILKDYQGRVLDELGAYAEDVAYFRGMGGRIQNPAAQAFTNATNRGWKPLTENPETPFVCLKIPTGGGKTLVAAHAVGIVFDKLLQEKQERGIVLWVTPSETIKSQTLRALKNEEHAYRKALEARFSVPVHVMDNQEALSLRPEQVSGGLAVIVSTIQALRRENKEGLKFYEDNGALRPHFSGEEEREDRNFSLFEVVRRDRPLVVADEGHNAKSPLALEVIGSLEPSFVLELTATPLKESNILSVVGALDLKREQMVKLPVNLHNLLTWQDTLREAVGRREALEEAAEEERKETGEYLRPMLLIQAEVEAQNPDKVHVARIKDYLINDLGVPESHVKIRTGKQDELGATDLMAEDVEVRHVITRDALREGWDAPFAYVLASVFRLSSTTAVEQLLGRVLRLPYVHEKRRSELNEAYVYTSAKEFNTVLASIVKAMTENGYGRDELRVKDGGGKSTPYFVDMEARHEGLTVPLMAVETGGSRGGRRRELRYAQDLLGPDFDLEGLGFVPAPLNDPLEQRGRLDVDENAAFKSELLGSRAGAVGAGGTKEDLVGWLLEKIGAYKELADADLARYAELAVDEHLKDGGPLGLLHRARYQLRDQIDEHLRAHYLDRTKASYEKLRDAGAGEKRLVADPNVAFAVPGEKKLAESLCATAYRNSVFRYPGKLNKEEGHLATDLDGLDNLICWYRNEDKNEFALQGYWRAKFNPDFIAFTKSGKVAVLEWKGGDRASNEDTRYKQALGDDWAALDPENRYFRVVGEADVQEILKEVGGL